MSPTRGYATRQPQISSLLTTPGDTSWLSTCDSVPAYQPQQLEFLKEEIVRKIAKGQLSSQSATERILVVVDKAYTLIDNYLDGPDLTFSEDEKAGVDHAYVITDAKVVRQIW